MMFGISGPGCQNPIEQTAFNAYAYHQQKIEDYINILAQSDNPFDWETQIDAIYESDIDYHSLTSDELDYIDKEVAKRHGSI